MRYHGKYCGPSWSAGQHQPSVDSSLPPDDDFDAHCKVHDAAYANNHNLEEADWKFAADNLAGPKLKQHVAGLVVGGQAVIRSIDRISRTITKLTPMNTQRLRGTATQPKRSQANTGGHASQIDSVQVPAAIGSVIRGTRAVTRNKTQNTLTMDVSVCAGRPAGATQSNIVELIGLQYLAPVALGNDEVQNMTRVYQHFRIKEATMRFRAFQGTQIGGEVIVISNDDPNYRPINTTVNGSFYQRAMSTEHCVLTPIWCSADVPLAVDTRWKVCDNSNSTTLEEFCAGVVYIYSDGSDRIPGYFCVSMVIEFEGLRFNSRNLISGSYLGLGVRQGLTVGATTLNSDAALIGTGFTTGDIYSVQLSVTGAFFAAAITASNLFVISSGSGTIPFTITGSTMVYARANSTTSLGLYTTYDSAVGGDTSDKLLYGVTAVAGTSLPPCVVTQLRNSTQPSS